MLPAGKLNGHKNDIQASHPLRWDVHLVKDKYYDDALPEQQLARAFEQRIRLKHALAY